MGFPGGPYGAEGPLSSDCFLCLGTWCWLLAESSSWASPQGIVTFIPMSVFQVRVETESASCQPFGDRTSKQQSNTCIIFFGCAVTASTRFKGRRHSPCLSVGGVSKKKTICPPLKFHLLTLPSPTISPSPPPTLTASLAWIPATSSK